MSFILHKKIMEDLPQIQDKIRKFIVSYSYREDEKIDNDTLLFEQGIMDSMAFMSLISFLDETFSIQPNDDELLEINFESIDAITGFVINKLKSIQ